MPEDPAVDRAGATRTRPAEPDVLGPARPLEGRGSEERLRRIRARFRRALPPLRLSPAALAGRGALVFVAVVALGLWLTR